MTRFIDDVNRMFDELLRTPWRESRPTVRHPGPAGPASVWELDVPAPSADPDHIGVVVHGDTVTVTLGGRETADEREHAVHVASERYQERRQSFQLPRGARVESIEAHIEDHTLRLRLRLSGGAER